MLGIFAEQNELGFAIADGVRKLRIPFVFRDASAFTNESHYESNLDNIIVVSDGRKAKQVGETWLSNGKNVLYITGGFLTKGYHRLALNKLNWVPVKECPSDRFDALDLPFSVQSNGDKILIATHAPNNFWTEQTNYDEIRQFVINMCFRITKNYSLEYIEHKKHPLDDSEYTVPCKSFVGDKIDWTKYKALVTHSSTIGFEAIRNGVAVVCDKSAPYANVANSYSCLLNPLRTRSPHKNPIMFPHNLYFNQDKKFFNRVAYGQWTIDEIKSGEALEWMQKNYISIY